MLLVALYLTVIPSSAVGAEQYEVQWRFPFDQYVVPEFTTYPSQFGGGNSPGVAYTAVLPVCDGDIKVDCLKTVEFQNLKGDWLSGNFQSYLPIEEDSVSNPGNTSYPYIGNKISKNPITPSEMPIAARSSIWQFPGINHTLGQDFLVSFWLFGAGDDKTGPREGPKMRASIQPMFSTSASIDAARDTDFLKYPSWRDSSTPRTLCYFQTNIYQKYCLTRADFKEFYPFRITVEVKKFSKLFWSVGSWLTTRVQESEIKVSKLSSDTLRISFTGNPIRLSSAQVKFPATVENYILGRKILNFALGDAWPRNNPDKFDLSDTSCFNPTPQVSKIGCFGLLTLNGSFEAESKESFFMWQELAKIYQIETYNPTSTWSFSTTENQLRLSNPNCLKSTQSVEEGLNSPSGYIASNANVIDPNPPTWNEENKSLEFPIAIIQEKNKVESIPTFYELRIKSEIARCLWKIELANAQAQIEILNTGNDQLQKLQTSSLLIEEGFLKFKVSGIDASSAIVRVKLISIPLVQETSIPKLSSPSAAIRKTLICTKGKISKKISGLSPKCPKGFKTKIL